MININKYTWKCDQWDHRETYEVLQKQKAIAWNKRQTSATLDACTSKKGLHGEPLMNFGTGWADTDEQLLSFSLDTLCMKSLQDNCMHTSDRGGKAVWSQKKGGLADTVLGVTIWEMGIRTRDCMRLARERMSCGRKRLRVELGVYTVSHHCLKFYHVIKMLKLS